MVATQFFAGRGFIRVSCTAFLFNLSIATKIDRLLKAVQRPPHR